MDGVKFMERAIELAKKGIGAVDPNPLVGAVIVKDGRVIGEGYHERIGGLHAERNALASLKEDAAGAVMYVTLEPCCHYGKTPPCTQAIIENKISKVVIGSGDPNPKVHGKGVGILRDAGIEVVEDFLKEEEMVTMDDASDDDDQVAIKCAPIIGGLAASYAHGLDDNAAYDGDSIKVAAKHEEQVKQYIETLKEQFKF